MAEKKSRGSDRTRNWSVVVYPESAPLNWRDIIDDFHIEWVESPLHEFDTDATGEVKKAHWHILLMFGGVKSYEQVLELVAPLCCPVPQRCHNARALVRYMAHLDNPDKHQYFVSDIRPHGGVDLAELLRPSSSERYTLIREMMEFVRDNHISEYAELVEYAMMHRFDDWFPLLCDSATYAVNSYIKSCRFRFQADGDGAKNNVCAEPFMEG